ncbi:5843_t:CDS:2 [Funneliformis caledonium]|uniref:5843_t:CDS:1 n=1 Tax=Funneliformis caledonium TaxID=1117310 RepID=A0A9N9G458_9GLOM|nr:5843_t:CDS:2 [Funneliformis caledonium]
MTDSISVYLDDDKSIQLIIGEPTFKRKQNQSLEVDHREFSLTLQIPRIFSWKREIKEIDLEVSIRRTKGDYRIEFGAKSKGLGVNFFALKVLVLKVCSSAKGLYAKDRRKIESVLENDDNAEIYNNPSMAMESWWSSTFLVFYLIIGPQISHAINHHAWKNPPAKFYNSVIPDGDPLPELISDIEAVSENAVLKYRAELIADYEKIENPFGN